MYSKTYCYLGNNTEDKFQTTSGSRQGEPESPYNYNMFADHNLKLFDQKCKDAGITPLQIPYLIPPEISSRDANLGLCMLIWLGYADDLIIFSISEKELQIMIDILYEIFSEHGLNINNTKTETMILNFKETDTNTYPTTICTIGDVKLNNTRTFKYLGAILEFDNPNTGQVELENRINSARGKFYQLKSLFTNRKIRLKTRVRFFESLVRSRLTYACQTWTLTKAQENTLNSAYTRMLRHLVKGGFQCKSRHDYTNKDGEIKNYGKFLMRNEEILKICQSEKLSDYIHRQQSKWIAHVVRQDDQNYTKQLCFETGKGKKRGVSSSTFKQVIKRFEPRSQVEVLLDMKNRKI